MTSRPIDRRAFLKTLGVSTALLPFVPSLEAHGDGGRYPRRLITFVTPNGMMDSEWNPIRGASESDFSLKRILQPLAPYKSRMLVLRGLDWKSYEAQPEVPNDHPPPLSHTLCATNVLENRWGGGPSIDQFIAQRLGAGTPFESLCLGANSFNADTGNYSYRAAREPTAVDSDPVRVFERVFGDLNLDDDARLRRRAERKSSIDLVRSELSVLERRVGVNDRRKIEAHLEHLHAIEMRMNRDIAHCEPPNPDAHGDENFKVRVFRRQADNIALAFACDLTRVVHLQYEVASSGMVYAELAPDLGDAGRHPHHAYAHFMADGVDRDTQTEMNTRIAVFEAELFRYLLDRLDSIQEGDGTLLDHSIVMWTSEHKMHNGCHCRDDLPYVLVGSGGGALRMGRLLEYGGVPHNDLYVSLCHAMGLDDVAKFGNPQVCRGPLSGLT